MRPYHGSNPEKHSSVSVGKNSIYTEKERKPYQGKVVAMQIEYKNIDPKLVVNEIRNGRSLESVQKLFGIKYKSEVQDLYLKGLMELGEIPQVDFNKQPVAKPATPTIAQPERPLVRRREKVEHVKPAMLIKTPNFRTIGHSGSITLNKALLIEQLGFGIGDSFEIYREDDGVVLKKIPSAS